MPSSQQAFQDAMSHPAAPGQTTDTMTLLASYRQHNAALQTSLADTMDTNARMLGLLETVAKQQHDNTVRFELSCDKLVECTNAMLDNYPRRTLPAKLPSVRRPHACVTCVVDPTVTHRCFRVGKDIERSKGRKVKNYKKRLSLTNEIELQPHPTEE